MHSKRVNRELRETRKELNESIRNRYSAEIFTELEDSPYDDHIFSGKTTINKFVDDVVDEQPRYMSQYNSSQPEYLDMSILT